MKSKEADSYLEDLEADRQAAPTRLRSLVFEVAPDAVETMHYRMPTYHYGQELLCAFASQKHYMSLYMDTRLVEKYRENLEDLDIGKSCIRFKDCTEKSLRKRKGTIYVGCGQSPHPTYTPFSC